MFSCNGLKPYFSRGFVGLSFGNNNIKSNLFDWSGDNVTVSIAVVSPNFKILVLVGNQHSTLELEPMAGIERPD